MTNHDRPGLTKHEYLMALEQLKQRGRAVHVNQAEQFVDELGILSPQEHEKAIAQLEQASAELESLMLDIFP